MSIPTKDYDHVMTIITDRKKDNDEHGLIDSRGG